MTKRDIISIAMKITGVVFLAYAILGVPETISSILYYRTMMPPGFSTEISHVVATSIVYMILYFIVAIALITCADRFARRLAGNDDGPISLPAGLETGVIFQTALRIVGVIFVSSGIPVVMRLFVEAGLNASKIGYTGSDYYGIFQGSSWHNLWPRLIYALCSIIIGGYLISGARNLVDFLYGKRLEPAVSNAAEDTI